MFFKISIQWIINLVSKPNEDTTKRILQANFPDKRTCKNPEQNKFNNVLKRSYTTIKWDLFWGCKDG